MICNKCGERSDQAAPQCVEISSSGVRFVEHEWRGGNSLSEGTPRGRSMRSLLDGVSSRSIPRNPPASQIPGGGSIAEYLKLSGITGQDPSRTPQQLQEVRPNPYDQGPEIRNRFLREDMPPVPGEFVREDMRRPIAKVENTGPLSHAQILRECAPICRLMGPGHMGTTNPGRMVRGAPIRVEYKQ